MSKAFLAAFLMLSLLATRESPAQDLKFTITPQPKAATNPAPVKQTPVRGSRSIASESPKAGAPAQKGAVPAKGAVAPQKASPRPATVFGLDGTRVLLDYPRFEGGIGINPGLYSLTQSLSSIGTKFNFSNPILLDFDASVRAYFSPRLIATVNMRVEHVSSAATDLVTFQLQDSSVTAVSVNGAVNYCFYLGNADRKLCPGVMVGYDNYPVLKFVDNTNLALTQLGDMSIGPNLLFIARLNNTLNAHVQAGYNFGLKQGQAAGFTMNSDHNIFVSADMVYAISRKTSLLFGLGVFSQSANFTSLQDQGTWSMSNLNFNASFGVKYNFNFSN